MKPPISEKQLTTFNKIYAIGYIILLVFIGSKRIFPFIPWGIIPFLLIAILGVLAFKRKLHTRPEFIITSICCILLSIYAIAEGIVHIVNGNNLYYIRSFGVLPLLGGFWLSIKWRYDF